MRFNGKFSLPVSGTPALARVLDFMRLIWALDHALQSASKRMAASIGVTGPQRLVIRIVGRFPAISAGRLAGILHVHPSTLTGVLRRLERRRLIRRGADPHDQRRSVLQLTATGRRQGANLTGTIEAGIARALGTVLPSELAAARVVLDRLARELQDEPAKQSGHSRRRTLRSRYARPLLMRSAVQGRGK